MFKTSNYIILLFIGFLFVMCKQKEKNNVKNESILKGSTTILVDETLTPIIEDQIEVFESKYNAKINIVSLSESEVVLSLFKEKSGIAILSRNLTNEEKKIFEQNKINPKITKFATDAIAFISNRSNKDTLVDIKDIINFLQSKPNSKIKGLVFDNPNSSTVRYMNAIAGIKNIPEKGVFSFKSNEEVIKFVAENDGMIGVVGLNWLSQPKPLMNKYIENLTVLSVKAQNDKNYYFPSQNNIAEGKYSLARELFIINGQGFPGLGMGFASFVAGDIGQRIILKSGLLPIRIPGRKINIRNEIKNEK
jgi:phosphate transport system substrate-binding protein